MYKKITLPNGLRILLVPDKNSPAVTALVLVASGSKYETKRENGLSHFLEHMFFKGTKKRPNTLKIAETLDRVGGIYNAFTSKEFTGYFAKVDSRHADLALDWLSDIFLHSQLPAQEITKEKGVILEELNMYLDTPTRYIGELWEKLLYGDQPAGWDTIGLKENILSFKRSDFLNYLKNHYSSQNTIICLAGNFQESLILKQIKDYFKSLNTLEPKLKLPVREGQTFPKSLVHFKKTDQTHLYLGFRGYHLFDKEIYAQEVLATMLGGTMSSRLFIEIREKRGLAYYVSSSSEAYTDSGYLAARAGVRNNEVGQVIELILKECRSLRDKAINLKELKKAKDYLQGSLLLGLETSDALASFYGIQELLQGKILTAKDKCAKIAQVKASDVKKAAESIFQPSKLNLALIGPHQKKYAAKFHHQLVNNF